MANLPFLNDHVNLHDRAQPLSTRASWRAEMRSSLLLICTGPYCQPSQSQKSYPPTLEKRGPRISRVCGGGINWNTHGDSIACVSNPKIVEFLIDKSQFKYEPFSTVTRNSLRHALADSKLSLDDSAVESVMKAYDSLSVFPEVPSALKNLSQKPSFKTVVFSNGTDEMVTNSIKSSPDLSPYASIFDQIITVEVVERYKPAPQVYKHLARKLGKPLHNDGVGSMWLVSGNPFDVVGAREFGMEAIWVDRGGCGWTDDLIQGSYGRPTLIVKGLDEVMEGIEKYIAS